MNNNTKLLSKDKADNTTRHTQENPLHSPVKGVVKREAGKRSHLTVVLVVVVVVGLRRGNSRGDCRQRRGGIGGGASLL